MRPMILMGGDYTVRYEVMVAPEVTTGFVGALLLFGDHAELIE